MKVALLRVSLVLLRDIRSGQTASPAAVMGLRVLPVLPVADSYRASLPGSPMFRYSTGNHTVLVPYR